MEDWFLDIQLNALVCIMKQRFIKDFQEIEQIFRLRTSFQRKFCGCYCYGFVNKKILPLDCRIHVAPVLIL